MPFKDLPQGTTHYENDNCGDHHHNWYPCSKEISRLSINELIPFEQTMPFKRLAWILDNKIRGELEQIIEQVKFNYRCGKCENKTIQEHSLSCRSLTELKNKLGLCPPQKQ